MARKDFISHDEMMDRNFGKKGTPTRDEYDLNLELFLVGDAIKTIRQSKNLTMETIMKVFKALDVDAKIHIGSRGVDIAMS